MGLDMYLYKKTYVKNWDHYPAEKQNKITVKMGGKTRKDIKPERISYITEQVAYWRKFNALHNWFVQKCGKGIDECQEIYIGEDKIEEILDILKKVKEVLDKSKKVTKVVSEGSRGEKYEISTYDCEDEINELLPPTSGFFFGGTDIDDYYKQDVEESIKIFETLLKENKEFDGVGFSGDFYYQASW